MYIWKHSAGTFLFYLIVKRLFFNKIKLHKRIRIQTCDTHVYFWHNQSREFKKIETTSLKDIDITGNEKKYVKRKVQIICLGSKIRICLFRNTGYIVNLEVVWARKETTREFVHICIPTLYNGPIVRSNTVFVCCRYVIIWEYGWKAYILIMCDVPL